MNACSALLILLIVAPIVSAQADGYSILPGSVSVEPTDVTKITGTYTMVHDPAGYPNITIDAPGGPATGTFGGGCLLYRPEQPIVHCTSAASCRRHVFPGYQYCLNESTGKVIHVLNLGGKLTPIRIVKKINACWAKPSEDYCLKSPTTPLTVDTVYKIAPVPRHIDGTTGPLFWRVVTCQNHVLFGCGGVDNTTLYGTPVSIAP